MSGDAGVQSAAFAVGVARPGTVVVVAGVSAMVAGRPGSRSADVQACPDREAQAVVAKGSFWRRPMTVGREMLFGGVFTFIGVGAIVLSVVWGGSGADVVLGVLWLVVAACWFGAALQQRRRERPEMHGERRR